VSADTAPSEPPSPRMRADARRNRERILRAARAVFVDEGPNVPLDEIARRADVGIATLYQRFPRRADLFRAVAVDVLTALVEAADRAIATEGDAFDALRRFLHSPSISRSVR
jgi:AcrR family transcriptional regulator